jgi:hypothetical protein
MHKWTTRKIHGGEEIMSSHVLLHYYTRGELYDST